ncbi:uncharacterized protein LOC128127106 [Lactuca sativa]|uniref:uncharacterized protein LOC128127106 n=1 Tax=Lactuca sativa TaxID=4236 RepID=UPI0022AE8D74|nr:uncharacterized protein LOC128127106 [Lactuca sativa]
MRQHRWLDAVKDYDREILYHPWKANMVADAFICKAAATLIRNVCMRMTVITPLLEQIREAHIEDMKEKHRKSKHIVGQILMEDAHKSRFFIHPGATKMYKDLHAGYWWSYMKWDVTWYSCLEMGRYHNGLHYKVTMDGARSGFDMGHHGLIDQERAFYPDQGSISAEKMEDIYIQEVVARYWVPVSVVSDRDIQLFHEVVARYWVPVSVIS